MKNKLLWFLMGVISTVFVFSGYIFFTSYDRNIDRMLKTSVNYKNVSIETGLSSDVCSYLADGDRTLYLGKLPDSDNAIKINSPSRATFYIYPSDENTVFIRYEPRDGINRNYKKSDFGDFNRYLQVLYELTQNEVFNETIVY